MAAVKKLLGLARFHGLSARALRILQSIIRNSKKGSLLYGASWKIRMTSIRFSSALVLQVIILAISNLFFFFF